jgi:SAM-dependent methyltransferase
MATNDQRDYAYLQSAAHEAQAKNVPYLIHLNQPIGIWNYIRIANDIRAQVAQGALLDWGCGYGQMTYLLRQRGFTVTPFDVGPADATLPDIELYRALNVVRSQHPTTLPFASGEFSAVLSSGVLEHVDEHSEPGNELKSLAEIARVLAPGGTLLIYQLPQRYAWKESLIRRFKLGYAHPRRYTAGEIRAMLENAGFRVRRIRRANLLPRNLTGIPERWRTLYSRFSHLLLGLDALLCRVPLLNQLAGVLEVTATKR